MDESLLRKKITQSPSITPQRGIYKGSLKMETFWDFPGGTVVKNLPANARDTGLSPGRGRSHMPQSN